MARMFLSSCYALVAASASAVFFASCAQAEVPTIEQLRRESSSKATDLANLAESTLREQPLERVRPSFSAQALPSEPSSEQGISLDEVTVTATRRPTRERNTTATTYTVSRDEIRAQGAITISDALSIVPGFTSAPSYGGVGNLGLSFFRGFDESRFLLLRDGIPLNRASDNRAEISTNPLEDIERIEVVTGGATLRYGANAVGGVINLITETPKGPPRFSFDYQTGSYGVSRYRGKFGGGDETFNYNLTYSGTVAFNDYPFTITIPNTPLFYGLQDVTPQGIPLFGTLRPEVGPPITLRGKADSSFASSDTYTAKFSFKPDFFNRLTLNLAAHNTRNNFAGPGSYSLPVCRGGPDGFPNGTLAGTRFLPLDANGNELPCDQQRFLPRTATALFASRFAYNGTFDGSSLFPTGSAYLGAEGLTGTLDFFTRLTRVRAEASVQWDYDITPTTSLNSYVFYQRANAVLEQPSTFIFNTNILGFGIPGTVGQLQLPAVQNPFSTAERFEGQTVLNTRISSGQTLSFGINFLEERVFQAETAGTSFSNNSIGRLSLFLIDDIEFSEQLKANLGIRFTSSSQFGPVATPAVGLRYNFSPVFSVRGNWSYVFRAPSISELYLSGFPFLANPNLRPEFGSTYDVGLDIAPASNLGIRITYFDTYLDSVISNVSFTNPDPGTRLFTPLVLSLQNLGTRRASGVELATDWQATEQLRLRVSWTNTDARYTGSVDTVSDQNYPLYYGYQDPRIAFNNVVVSFYYANRGFLLALTGRYDGGKRRGATSGQVAQGASELVPAWATLDLAVELPITENLVLTGNVFNLTDTQYEYIGGTPAAGTTWRVGGRLQF